MKIQFDANQAYQLDAVQAVVDGFAGQPERSGGFDLSIDTGSAGLWTELGTGNSLALDDEALLANVRAVQQRSDVTVSEALQGRHFTVEMETGTGKTYVYLRTIYELNARYGFSKFIVVVPTVAIREGVLKNLEITREHFAALYGKPACDWWVYDSKQVSRVRQFAGTSALQILVINIDSFNKPSNNVIHAEMDRLGGRKPLDFIRATQPIVIVDEPQNMESEQAQSAITSLNPLCTLRYSATHKNLYNLVYRLDPIRAYDLKLVKRIEVDSVLDDPDFNKPFIRVETVAATKTQISAKLVVDVQQSRAIRRKRITVGQNSRGMWKRRDLLEATGGRPAYAGYTVEGIDVAGQTVTFSNGVTLAVGQEQGARSDDLMRIQIRETVLKHLTKELETTRRPAGERLKVLSLFFIDQVANYADTPSSENPRAGILKRFFEEEYSTLAASEAFQSLGLPAADRVQSAYFARTKDGAARDTRGDTAADDAAYELIMRDKERLLDPAEPVRFIFSHSALREGWDNPNVFQICTLNETRSEIKKRQEIGRGLRLAVNESGVRVFDAQLNRLTVIANESYADFAAKLQREMEDECGVSFEGRIQNARERRKVQLRKGWQLNDDFLQLWNRIKHKTRYAVEYDSDQLVNAVVVALKSMPTIEPPRVRAVTMELELTTGGVGAGQLRSVHEAVVPFEIERFPDLIGYLQKETELTRQTLVNILIRSGRLAEGMRNPQQLLDFTLRAIRYALDRLIIEGIKYERIAGACYEMMLFEQHEVEGYLSRLLSVEHSIHDAIQFDSAVERDFAAALDGRSDIRLFVKLPAWFKVETPIGTYNPDWAIVKQVEGGIEKLYLVRETKATPKSEQLRDREYLKIQCGRRHFDTLGVDFKTVVKASEV